MAAVLLYLLVDAIVSVPYRSWIKRRRPDVESQAKARGETDRDQEWRGGTHQLKIRPRNQGHPKALAESLLVDGGPIANIQLVEVPTKNSVVIMKDAKVYKNIASR
jgi:hypothetical protein